MQKINFISNFFFEILYSCADIVNLLFWELRKCLTISLKIIVSICSKFSCLTCMQKVNFVFHFFLKILQRNSKRFVLGNLGMSGHTHQNWQYHFEETSDNYQQGKSTQTFTFSLKYCKDIIKLLFWVLWACLAMHTQSDTVNLRKIFVFICRLKINFIAHAFLEILQRYANLFKILWACLAKHNQNDSINF